MKMYSMREMTDGVKLNIPARAWTRTDMPRRILAIRLQAMGDLVACLPYLQYLRRNIPGDTRLDLLTTEETSVIPRHIDLFDKVYAIGGGRNFKKQVMHSALLMPSLLRNRYEVVLDLQNNSLSRFVRRLLLPRAWTAFDRFSPVAGGERYRMTIEAAGLGVNKADYQFSLKAHDNALAILKKNGWHEEDELVVLNPAAAFETRNWNMPNYVLFAGMWKNEFPKARFLVLGTSFIEQKAQWLKEQLGDQLINLVGKTTAFEAFAILQRVKMVLSEDSGLMHMAWCSGVPTMGLFGGTRTDWVRLLGEHTFFLDASDLACGGCMQATCRFGDVHCLLRYSPEIVFYHARSLYQKMNATV